MIGISGERRVGLDAPRRLVAVDARKLDVHEDEVRLLRRGRRVRALAVMRLDHVVARGAQQVAQDLPVVLVILDDQDALGHAVPPCRRDERQRECEGRAVSRPRTRPRAARHASRRCGARWRGPGPCRPWRGSMNCRPAEIPRRSSADRPRDAGAGVAARTTVKPPLTSAAADLHLARVGELDGVADEVQHHLRQAPLVAPAPAAGLAPRRASGRASCSRRAARPRHRRPGPCP